MKKLLCLLLTVVMLASLGSCFGGGDTDDVRGEISGGNSSQTENSSEDESSGQSDNSSQTESEPEFSLGKSANNTYKNDFLGLSCTLPSSWLFYTDAQILQLNNIVGDVIDDNVASQLENATIIYDMYAAYLAEGSNVNVNLEKLSAVQLINLDIKQVLESQIDTIKSTYQDMGYTDTNVVYKKIKVDGKDFDSLSITAKIQGVDFYATVFTFRKGNYLANVTVGSLQTDKTETILGYFNVE